MVIHPKNSFKRIINILDSINPFLIIISIIGLYCEYTSLKAYVLLPNKIISIIFVIDFAIRIISFNIKDYILKGYGWVDFLASLPGIFFFLDNTPLFAVFKIIKVGRFFKIIRILRFLRVFNFLKKMKSDSVWIQDRIMKIGVTIVLIFVCGIIVVDNRVQTALQDRESKIITVEYNALGQDINKLLKSREDIKYYTIDSILYNRDGNVISNYNEIFNLFANELESYLVLMFTEKVYIPAKNLVLPSNGVIVPQGVIGNYQNSIMLSLLTTLLVILTVIIFYMGFVFAKDIQIIQLIIDSFDAEDYLLLKQEAEHYREQNGELVLNSDDSEIINLLKVAANRSNNTNSDNNLFMNLTGFSNEENIDNNEVSNRLNNIEEKLDDRSLYLVEETVKRLTPSILKYIKKELKD